jgi:hypothetical protein
MIATVRLIYQIAAGKLIFLSSNLDMFVLPAMRRFRYDTGFKNTG